MTETKKNEMNMNILRYVHEKLHLYTKNVEKSSKSFPENTDTKITRRNSNRITVLSSELSVSE